MRVPLRLVRRMREVSGGPPVQTDVRLALDRLLPLLEELEPLGLVEIDQQTGADRDRLSESPSCLASPAIEVSPSTSARIETGSAWFATMVWPRLDRT